MVKNLQITFTRLWVKITETFNRLSQRSIPSTIHQLQRMASKLRSDVRAKQDKTVPGSSKVSQSLFRKACAKTGGGRPPTQPEGASIFYLDGPKE